MSKNELAIISNYPVSRRDEIVDRYKELYSVTGDKTIVTPIQFDPDLMANLRNGNFDEVHFSGGTEQALGGQENAEARKLYFEAIQRSFDMGALATGVCFGMQGILRQAGASISKMPEKKHGISTTLDPSGNLVGHEGTGVFRSHSWQIPVDQLPQGFDLRLQSPDGGIDGASASGIAVVQFHPEVAQADESNIGPELYHTIRENALSKRKR